MKKIVAGTLAFALSALGLTGCGSNNTSSVSSEGTIVLDAVVSKPEATAGYQDLAQAFHKLHPNIEIKFEGQSSYAQTLQARLAANNPPDLMAAPGGNYGFSLAKDGQLLDLSDQAFLKNIRSSVLDSQKYNGKIYSMPIDMAAQGVIYNKDVFDKLGLQVPKTWPDFIAACQKIKSAGVTPVVMAGKDAWTLAEAAMTLATPLVYGPDPQFDMNVVKGTKSFTGPEWTKAMADYQEVTKYANPNIDSVSYQTGNQMMATGKAAMVIQGIWTVAAIKQFNQNAHLGFFLPPTSDTTSKETMILGPDLTIGVSSKTKHQKEALQFLEFMTTKQAVDIWTKDVQTISATQNSPTDFNDVVKDVGNYISNGDQLYPLPNHMWFEQNVWSDWSAKLQEVGSGSGTIDDAQNALENSLKKAYQQYSS